MKRLLVVALALGLAVTFAGTASAGLMDKLCHRDNGCDPCKPKCEPCKPACPKPACDPCDPCARKHHLGGKLKGLFHGTSCHCNRCDPCNGGNGGDAAPAPAPMPEGKKGAAFNESSPRLTPVPDTTTSIRSSRRY